MISASDTRKTVLLTPKYNDILLECVVMCGWIHAYPLQPAKYSFYCQYYTTSTTVAL